MSLSRPRLTLVIGILALVVVGLVAWFFVLSPRLSEAAKLDKQAQQLEDANLNLRTQYSRGLELAKDAPTAAAEAQALLAQMPQTAELPAVLEAITKAATDAGIAPEKVESLTTAVPVPVSQRGDGTARPLAGVNLAQMELVISAKGKAVQARNFIENLQNLERAMLITSTQRADAPQDAGTSGQPDQSVQVAGSMFVLQSQLPDLVANVDALLAKANLPGAQAQ